VALGDCLGEEHDLAVLDRWLAERVAEESVRCLRGLVASRRDELQQQALVQADRLFVDRPRVVLHRVSNWWKTAKALEALDTVESHRTNGVAD
jgi:hypothetical protein